MGNLSGLLDRVRLEGNVKRVMLLSTHRPYPPVIEINVLQKEIETIIELQDEYGFDSIAGHATITDQIEIRRELIRRLHAHIKELENSF